jgi:chlorite dismutase
MLDEQGYISLEESKQFMQMYIAYAYGIGDDLR